MSKEVWSQVTKFRDGESLNADTLNIPVSQLSERTEYLYARLKALIESDKMSSVVLTDVPLSSEEGAEPVVGNVVYLDQENYVASRAKATMSLYDDFSAAESAFSIGILIRKEGNTGDILINGRLNLNPAGAPLRKTDMIETGETYRSGRYYLSANEAGKLTANPNGPLIYVCSMGGIMTTDGSFTSGTAVITPQFLDIGTSHIHRTAVLTARPAGTLSIDGYLPIKYLDEDGNLSLSAMALRFGGTWTADGEVSYKFSLSDNSGSWPNNVRLQWLEWVEDPEKAVADHVDIPGPDIEVPISNGLTVRLSLPDSNNKVAYTVDDARKREWDTLVFPDAGKGWLAHCPMAIATLESDGDTPKPHIAIRGKMPDSPTTVNFATPGSSKPLQLLSMSKPVENSTFSYNSATYAFTLDVDSFKSTNGELPVALGSNFAGSIHNLAMELNKLGNGQFAVFDGGDGVVMVAINAETISEGGIVASSGTRKSTGYDISGENTGEMSLVVYNANGWVLGTNAVVDGIKSYSWYDIGDNLAIMVYQDVGKAGQSATIAAGTVMSCVLEDKEPNALYDYSIGFEQAVAKFWPPVPAKSAALIVNGVEMDNKALLPASPTVSFGRDTIHWFEDAEGRKPWPEAFIERGEPIDPGFDKTEVMHWVRGFQGSTGPVTSLQVRDGSPFRVVGFGTNETANCGDLEIVGDFDFSMVDGGAPGYIVPKHARGGKLIGGPTVERIVGGPGISVISRAGQPNGQGTVIVALDDGAYHHSFTDIALENAEQAKIGMFPYIRLKGYSSSITSPSAFTATMRVPANLPDGEYALHILASVFGENGFTSASILSACVNFTYNILPDFDVGSGMAYRNLKSSLLKPNSDRKVLIPFGHVGASSAIEYNGFDPILVTTEGAVIDSLGVAEANREDVLNDGFGPMIPTASDFRMQNVTEQQILLRPGNLVGIRISRAVTPAGAVPYTGPIGFINLSWALMAVDKSSTRHATTTEYVAATIMRLKAEVDNKVAKDALAGMDVETNTAAGIRTAVKATSTVLGANVIK
jgi:hypothetical protein